MDTLAPQVVAVVVTHDPGPWFEETLRSLQSQDYPALSLLVLDADSAEDPTPRIAAVAPGAFVRRLEVNAGYGVSANAVLGMVEGASHYLFLHDDVALDPDVVRVLVEEAFRSNAGVVGPKHVRWDDPSRLLHVGMGVDKEGAVVDRIEPDEVDHGQHDAVRDVFLAPGGCTLVRADLFAELGGFDPHIVVMGEDLDLCWRAQVLGARVLVAPDARVRHLELLAGGARDAPEAVVAPGPRPGRRRGRPGDHAPSTHELQRRHELHVAFKAYSPAHRIRVLPQVVTLALAEATLFFLAGRPARARLVTAALRWNVRLRAELRVERRALSLRRRLPDAAIRRLQLRGSARLTRYLRRALLQGLAAAHRGDEPEAAEAAAPARAGRSAGRIALIVAVALVVVFGTRSLFGAGLPAVGQLLPMPSWSGLLGSWFSSWQPAGLGSTSPVSPGAGILGLAGLALGGHTAQLVKLLLLGSIPFGAFGVARLTKPFGSAWGRAAAVCVYLLVPVPYDAIARGRLQGVLIYALTPWILRSLARASALAPFAGRDADSPSWRRGPFGAVLGLGVLDATLTAVVPSAAFGVLTLALGMALGVLVTIGGRPGGRAAARVGVTAAAATGVAVVLLAPWSISVFADPLRASALAGGSDAPTWDALLRLAVGPIGDTPVAVLFLVAAGLPLLIGAGRRLAWAGRAWIVLLVALLVAWLGGRGWLGPVDVPADVLLPGAAAAIAMAVGLGVAAFETDLRGHRFGWRQLASVTAAAAAIVAAVPVVAASGGGRWDLPGTGFAPATGALGATAPTGGFRILWLGDPRALPGRGWPLSTGVDYELSESGLPGGQSLWTTAAPGAAAGVAADVELARAGRTIELGGLLATYAVRYVVVVTAPAPEVPGVQTIESIAPPPDIAVALRRQIDLDEMFSTGGYLVFANPGALPERAVRGPTGWIGALPGRPGSSSYRGAVPTGLLVSGVAPAAAWTASVDGKAAPRRELFGYAAAFDLRAPPAAGACAALSAIGSAGCPAALGPEGRVTLQAAGSSARVTEVTLELLAWLVALAALLGRRRGVDWWWRPLAARRRARARHVASRGHGDDAAAPVDPSDAAPEAAVGAPVPS